MKWTFTSDAEAYAKVVEPWLFRDPVRNTTPITVLRGVRDGLWGDDVLLGLLERDGEVVAAALQTAPLLLLLPDIPVETVPGLAARLVEAGRAIPGVFGPLALAEAFAGAWWRPEIGRRDERLYRLGALAPPPLPVEGACRTAGVGDVLLFTDLSNPTSNAIYQAIGYRPVADYLTVRFA